MARMQRVGGERARGIGIRKSGQQFAQVLQRRLPSPPSGIAKRRSPGVPRSRSSRMRASSLPVTPSMCSISSRTGSSCTTTGVMEMDSAASELSFTRTVCGQRHRFSR